MLESDELANGSFGRGDQLADRAAAVVRFEHGKAQVEIAILASILDGLVKQPDVDLGRLEDDKMIGLHFACALRTKVAAHARLEPVETGLANVDGAKVLDKIVERYPKHALVVCQSLMIVMMMMMMAVVVEVVLLSAACLLFVC